MGQRILNIHTPPYPIPEDGKGYICICPYIFQSLRFCLKRQIFKVIVLALSVGLECLQNKAYIVKLLFLSLFIKFLKNALCFFSGFHSLSYVTAISRMEKQYYFSYQIFNHLFDSLVSNSNLKKFAGVLRHKCIYVCRCDKRVLLVCVWIILLYHPHPYHLDSNDVAQSYADNHHYSQYDKYH